MVAYGMRPARNKEESMWRGMKFGTLGFAVLVFLASFVTTRAQDAETQESKAQAQTEAGPHHGQQLERLSKELNLTDEQKEKVKPILDEQTKQMRATQDDTSLSQEQKRDKMKQIHQTTHSQINEILTPEQQKKFAALKEQQKSTAKEAKRAHPSSPSNRTESELCQLNLTEAARQLVGGLCPADSFAVVTSPARPVWNFGRNPYPAASKAARAFCTTRAGFSATALRRVKSSPFAG
jgi:Spy/CpxP family protein refolding chaperone